MLYSADHLWTADFFVRRDHVVLTGQPDFARTGEMWTMPGHKVRAVPGRDGKGWALDIDGFTDDWLVLGESTCKSYGYSICKGFHDWIGNSVIVQTQDSEHQTSFTPYRQFDHQLTVGKNVAKCDILRLA